MTKEQDFKNRFFAVLKDVQEDGVDDGEAMWLLGRLAAGLVDDLQAPDWSTAKRDMTPETYDTLLRSFEIHGNAHHKAGQTRQAYVIQVMVVSLIARTQNADPQIAAGEPLLDQVINASITGYRQQAAKPN